MNVPVGLHSTLRHSWGRGIDHTRLLLPGLWFPSSPWHRCGDGERKSLIELASHVRRKKRDLETKGLD